MDGATVGLIGGITGAVVGCLGGALGTYLGIRSARSRAERRFLFRWSVLLWLAIIVFLAALWLIPTPYRFFLWIPYPFLLLWFIHHINQGSAQIRASQSDPHEPPLLRSGSAN